MKIKLLFAVLFFTTSQAQNNFKIDDHKIVWEKIFSSGTSTDSTFKSIEKHLRAKAIVFDLSFSDNTITAKSRGDEMNLKKMNLKPMSTPMVCSRNFDYGITVEVKDSRYRVTITDITIDDRTSNGMLSGSLSNFALKKNGEMKTSNAAKDALDLYDQHFTDMFSPESIFKKSSDW